MIEVLDTGYVQFIEAWGTGEAGVGGFADDHGEPGDEIPNDYEVGIIEAARQSTQASFRGWAEDEKLLGYLFNSKPPHSTPFEFAGMVLQVQAPIFVFREWHRHRTQSYNEMSARYAPLPDLYYLPERRITVERGRAATSNKQASAVAPFNEGYVDAWLSNVSDAYRALEALYQAALANGIPKEMARITMPVAHYSRMRASANLRNWLAFLTLRMDPKAQWEIRQYANAVAHIVEEKFPRTYKLFCS